MRTIKSAAETLSAASTLDTLRDITRQLGFDDNLLPLDAASLDALGVPEHLLHDVRVIRGTGQMRALLIESRGGESLRSVIGVVARGLAERAPHILWMLLLTEHGGSQLGMAVWSAADRPIRIGALLVDRTRVLASDAETLCALVAACTTNDLATHVSWLEVLGRDALTRRFYATMRDVVHDLAANAEGPGDAGQRRELALLQVSRLLFLSFLEAKGWLDRDRAFLSHAFAHCCESGGGFQRRVLQPLFFGTLNTRQSARAPIARQFGRIPFLNGGLFTRTPVERRLRRLRFGDEQMGRLFSELLGRYRFTAREDSTTWSEAAVDPEMLGKAFESLMASATRKDSGAFYTPQTLVERVTRSALVAALASPELDGGMLTSALHGESLWTAQRPALLRKLSELKVLDPACGSGAFLVHMLSELASLRRMAGDERPTSVVRRELLTTSIFGVDLNPTAVWLCELRLWLAAVIDSEEEDPMRVPPLPNLDHHIRIGDTVLGGDFTTRPGAGDAKSLTLLRTRYARATGARKAALSKQLDHAERRCAREALITGERLVRNRRRDLLSAQRGVNLFGERNRPDQSITVALSDLRARGRELQRSRRRLEEGGALPFSFATHFPDVAAAGGFGLVIGNPPWVRLHRIPCESRDILRREYLSYRNAAWRDGAAGAHAGSGFASQVDLAALFAERSLSLLREGGALGLLLPAKLWRSLAGGGVRRLLAERSRIIAVEDWSDAPAAFDAAVYPSLLVAQRQEPRQSANVLMVRHRAGSPETWSMPVCTLGVRPDAAAPWLMLPDTPRRVFRQLADIGVALSDAQLGRALLGVKCGFNDAYVVTVDGTRGDIAQVRSGRRDGDVESALLRPALRGADVREWRARPSTEFIIWTHDETGRALQRLPRHSARWFAGWQRELCNRTDARTSQRWWSLYRTEAARHDRPRVVWSDFGQTPRALVLPSGDPTVPLNSCYVFRCATDDDAFALCAVLNSPLAAAWLNAIAEPARGGFHRYLAWTVAMLPLPRDWDTARRLLGPLGRAAHEGARVDAHALLDATLAAYGDHSLDPSSLLEWTHQ